MSAAVNPTEHRNAAEDDNFARAVELLRVLHGDLMEGFTAAADADGKTSEPVFRVDEWRSALGLGASAVAEGDALWERVLIGFSQVGGEQLPEAATARHPELAGQPWAAAGVSLVAHPASPWIATTHLNVRVFQVAGKEGAAPTWWFGGGFDLTPYYPQAEDCRLWHEAARDAVEPFADGLYAEFKEACDEYFYLPHRGEARGIGGIFFDDFDRLPFASCLDLIARIERYFLAAYLQLVEKHRSRHFTPEQRQFQLLRRGRYAEFNLALDRGTRFGLNSGGRTESILASLPPLVRWEYDFQPEDGSPEAALADFLQPQDWLQG